MRLALIVGFAAILVFAACVGPAGPQGPPGPSAEIVIEPLDAVPGDTVRIKGSGFPAKTAVDIYIRDNFWVTVTTNVSGAFEVFPTVPSLSPDVYTIRAFVGDELWATHPLDIMRIECEDATFEAGDKDNFTLPLEPTSPSADLLLLMDPYGGGDRVLYPHRQFDDVNIDRVFGHTFTGLPPGIVEATLEITLRLGGLNDSISLERAWSNNANPLTYWKMGLTDLYTWDTGLSWNLGDPPHTFTLDLANLPPDAQNITDIIPFMNADQALDVYVQDDTAVDYMILTVCWSRTVETPLPDLTVTITAFTLGICDGAGCTVIVDFEVENIGNAAAGPFDVYIDEDTGGFSPLTIQVTGGLIAGGVATFSETLGPGGIAAIAPTVTVTVDSGFAVTESNENNNTDSLPLQ